MSKNYVFSAVFNGFSIIKILPTPLPPVLAEKFDPTPSQKTREKIDPLPKFGSPTMVKKSHAHV